MKTGVYEQIINRLFKVKLEEVDTERFFVGKKAIDKFDAVNLLTKYLQHLIEQAFASAPEELSAEQCTQFVNSVSQEVKVRSNVC